MTDVFARLGRAVARRPRAAVLVWVLLAVVAYLVAGVGVTGQTVFDRLSTGAPAVPGSESDAADAILAGMSPGARNEGASAQITERSAGTLAACASRLSSCARR